MVERKGFKNEHYSRQNGHSARSRFHYDVRRLIRETGMPTDQAFILRRSMLRTPDSGRK